MGPRDRFSIKSSSYRYEILYSIRNETIIRVSNLNDGNSHTNAPDSAIVRGINLAALIMIRYKLNQPLSWPGPFVAMPWLLMTKHFASPGHQQHRIDHVAYFVCED